VDADAPLILVGGGARGQTWQNVVRRLSGRSVSIPEATELVAIGAAVQAAAILQGEPPQDVAARWRTARGTLLPALERDAEAIERHRGAPGDQAIVDPRGRDPAHRRRNGQPSVDTASGERISRWCWPAGSAFSEPGRLGSRSPGLDGP
jgi:xylulokinase